MFGWLLALLFVFPQDQPKPFPELKPFLAEVRKTLRSDRQILSHYTYTAKETVVELDSDRKPKKTEVKVFEVFPGVEPWQTYRRLISRDGVPLSEKEMEKQDREQKEDVESRQRKLQKKTQVEVEREKAKAEREEAETIDDVFQMSDFEFLRREVIGGHPTIVVSFKAKPGVKAKTREGKIWQHLAGEAWVSEDDHELVRIDAEVIDTISLAFGLLARLHKGARLSGERQKFNNEVWLPVRTEAAVSARLLLLKGINIRQVTEYSDHKKYTVETIIKVPGQ